MKITMDDSQAKKLDTKKSKKIKKGKAPKPSKKARKVVKKPTRADSIAKAPRKTQKKSTKQQNKRAIVGVPTSKQDKLVDLGIMRRHNFLSYTTPMLTKIFHMTRVDNKSNKYETDREPHHVSAILKLVLSTIQTNELSDDWSLALWNITQQDALLPDDCYVTFTRVFERKDNDFTKKKISRRRKLSILSSNSEDNVKRQSVAVSHDKSLVDAIDTGDSVLSFGAEAIVSAPDEQTLEVAIDAVKNYLKANDETRGLSYELDINKQSRPFVTYGPNEGSGNRAVFNDMTSMDAATSALVVDSGGDRTLGSEYVGVSVGKLIKSHAAYNFQNGTSLYIGNDTTKQTTTLDGIVDEPSQVYLSRVASRAYLLAGHKVVHFVADDAKTTSKLMAMPIDAKRKCAVDVSMGMLNMLEAIDAGDLAEHPERILARFPTHIDNIITLLSQFRDVQNVSVNDSFAKMARDILIDFYVVQKYWSYDARYDLDNLRLIGVKHNQVKKLSDFGQYVEQRKKKSDNKSSEEKDALSELDTIINRNILPTIPSLDTKTDDIIDELVEASYSVIDLTGMTSGAVVSLTNPSMNVMMISYLNLLLPSLSNGDVIVIHGVSQLASITPIIKSMIASYGLNIDVIYTERNQDSANSMLDATSDELEEADTETNRMATVKRAMHLDFVAIDLYNNRSDKLIDQFNMDREWVTSMAQIKSSFFIQTETGLDYIFLDKII